MNLDNFLFTTDANNQKQYVDTDVTIATSTSSLVSYTIHHTVGDVPDVRVWVRPTLMGKWKKLGMVQLIDGNDPSSEGVVGQVLATTDTVTVELSPTSLSSVDVITKIRIYYND